MIPNRCNWSVSHAGRYLPGDGPANRTAVPLRPTSRCRPFIGVVVTLTLWFALPAAAVRQEVDTDRSTITVRVSNAGLFHAFADNHEIQAPIRSGFVEDGVNGRVQVVVDSQRLRVLDPGLSPHDRAEIQARMLGPDVLDATRFVEIRFESTAASRLHRVGVPCTVHSRCTVRHGP
jgi:polyisoprenoid-binding protein YceI